MKSLYKHIVIPVDFSGKDSAALRVAKTLAKQNDARVTLLHVIETIDYVEDEEVADFYEKVRKAARTRLQFLTELFAAEVIEAEGKIVIGQRARGIVAYVMQHDVDLVILSSHRVSLDEPKKGWSTLSYQVSVMCPCHVLLVK